MNTWRMARLSLAAIVAVIGGLLIAPAAATAATLDASITGRVLTNGGAVVKGATVQAKNSDGAVTTTHSDSEGKFYLTGLKAGTYGVKFSDHLGLNPCQTNPCTAGFTPYYTTEWLGDSASFAASEKIRLSAGEKHSGVRELFDFYSRLSGHVSVNGQPAKGSDGVGIDLLTSKGKVVSSALAGANFFEDVENVGNYRIRVSSTTGAFAAFYVVDPRDGNYVFHLNGIEKITGVNVAVTLH